jgi:ABC-2 type transport system permease protein
MFAVYKREFRAYMHNVYGWLFMSVLLLFVGFMVFLENLMAGASYIEYALLMGEYALVLLVPVLCMRSMAEDRRNKTDLFYFSLPIKTSSVVLGKYFALLSVLALPCAVIAVYPILLGMFGSVNFAGAYSAILFFFLLGAALIAVCQFTSALTDNLVVAAVLGVAAMLILLVLPLLDAIMPVEIFSFVAPFVHFEEAATYGLFNIRSLVLLLSYPVFFVFLTTAVVDKKRLS